MTTTIQSSEATIEHNLNVRDDRLFVSFETKFSNFVLTIGLNPTQYATVNYGYGCWGYDAKDEPYLMSREDLQDVTSKDERLIIISELYKNTGKLLDDSDLDDVLITRGPTSREKVRSKRYVGVTDVFFQKGFKYYACLVVSEDEVYIFHSKHNIPIPKQFPSGIFTSMEITGNEHNLIFDHIKT